MCFQVGYHRKINSFPWLFHETVQDLKHCLGVSIGRTGKGLKLSVFENYIYLIFLKIIGPLL